MKTTITLLTLAGLSLCPTPVRADDPPPAKDAPLDASFLRLYAETRGFMLGRPVKPKPTPDGKAVLYLRGEARVPKLKLYEFDTATAKTRELLSPESLLKGAAENLSPEEKARRERMRVSTGGFADFQLSDFGNLVLLSLSGKLYLYERDTGEVTELKIPPGAIDPKFAPRGGKIAYVRDYDLYAYDLNKDKETRVTTGGTEEKTHGLAEFVAQEEMGRFSGFWWSPDGKYLAYEEADHTGVETWWVADPAKPDQTPHKQYYPRPGKQNVKVRLGIVPVTGGEMVWVEWDHAKYEYLASVRWQRTGWEALTIVVQDRLQQHMALLKVNPETGETETIVEETDKAWVNLHQSVPRAIMNQTNNSWVWLGAGPSDVEVQILSPNGQIENIAVPAADRVSDITDVYTGEYRVAVVYTASTDPTQRHVFRYTEPARARRPGSENPAKLTRDPGLHSAVFDRNGYIYALTSTTLRRMPMTSVYAGDTRGIGELTSVAEEPSFTPNVTIQKVGDGEGYYTAVVRPRNFDPKKKYPVIVHVYGGPKHQTVVQAMRDWLLPQWLADQGFIVVAIDNRGTPGRGHDWERSVYLKFGTVPLEDQVAGLKALGAKFPELDLDRVGITGWSFGGYMSALAVLRRPDVFKAAVAGAPVTDWEDYDTHYTERYMGLPKDHPEAYKEASLLTYADKLERPLLLVHGTADDNVYFRHSLRLANALFRAGKEFEILPLSGLTHMVPDPVVTERLWTRTAGHFRKHLGTPK